MELRVTTNSFDLFDTLVARRCVTAAALFSEVGAAFGMRDFATARIAAEQRCSATGRFGIDTIYEMLRTIGYVDAELARKLMEAEIQAEYDNAIPIRENIAAVRDFDLVISDMYLPPTMLRSLMQHVGLRRSVYLFVDNAAKNRGEIWPQLMRRWLIHRHVGDNAHSDVAVPRQFGIPAVHYVGAGFSRAERYLDDSGLPQLARTARELRLANPFPEATLEGLLWNHFAGLNLPLLILFCVEVLERRRLSGHQRLLLVDRDCHFLTEIFTALFPVEPVELIHVSRAAMTSDGASVASYLKAVGVSDALVCDLVSTGRSWLRLASQNRLAIDFFALVFVDDYLYEAFDQEELKRLPGFRFSWALRSSAIGTVGKAIEVMNTAPHGSTLAVELIGNAYAPQFSAGHELPASVLNTLMAVQAIAVGRIREGRQRLLQEAESFADRRGMLGTLIRSLCVPAWLNELAKAV